MDVPNESEDNLYQVPRSSNEINLPADFPSAVPDETPPALMPKRLSGFQRTSSLLDRQFPSSTPHPPPRSSRSACSNPKDHRTVSQISSTKSLDLTEPLQFKADEESIPKQTAKTILSATPSKKPLPPIPQTAQATPASTLENNVSVNKNNDITILQPSSHTSNSTSMTRPVPKPRPRTKVNVLPTPSQNLDFNSATQQTAVISSSPHSDSKQQISVIKNHKLNESSLETSTADEENISSFSYSLPLDADSIELMLNDEVDKKYGLKSTENKHPESGNHQLNINTDDNDEYVNPDELKQDISALRNNEKADSKPPMPHSTVQASSYLPMNDKSQHGQTAASQLPPLLKRRPSLPVSVPKFDIGSDLFGESSCDDILEPKDSFDEKFNASTCLNVTTPKPFNDIKPFKSFKSASILPSAASGKDTLQETKTQDLDFSDFDPLWSGKPKLAQASNINQKDKVNFSNGNKTVSDFAADFNFLTDSSEYQSSSIPSSTYATADDICAEDYCSEIERESKTKTTSGPWRSPSNRKSFHHEAPIAPPPPLPRQQNRIPEPRPPPVPPRPDNALVLPHPPNTQTLPSPPNALSYSTTASTDIFQDLPTPVFMPAQNNDPFHDSNFDYECLKFNKNQVPTPPSRSPLPKTSTLHVERPSNESNAKAASIDPSLDPGRISRFVIPPPGCPLNDSLNNEGYDLARELSSSDSESTDFPILDTSFQGWPPGAVPVAMPLKVFDSSLSQNKSSRDGYLYKQGGYKANKGWKKRWVVFNGSSLSYYTSNTSQVSKRIIPVRCMIRTETDIKDTDKNSFKFKVITSLKDRVFLFSSETLDDCIKWASVIMAAITEYKKSVGSGEELPPEKPDKEGFIKFGNLKKYYVTITGKTLCYYQSFEDYQMGSPTHEIDMKLCAVKVKDNKKLQLWIHYGQFDLTFESEQEMQQWRMAMEDAIAEGLADDTVLIKVYENLSNHNCADCNADNPHWASINLGIVVCKMCAGVHRMFDYRISKIRSLRMDTRVWTPSLIEIMITIGNANANQFWEFDVPEGAKIMPTDTMDKRKEYIVRKYKHKEFCNLHPLANCGSALGEALLTAASNDNVLELIKILFSGVDVLFKRDEHGHTAYDIAKENGQRLIMELLYQNGGDPKTLEQDVRDENRLKEDIRLQGFLNKSGPIGKTFKRRWCILEHGALTYYLNEKSNTSKGSIDRKDMYMIQVADADRLNYSFELSTKLEDNRVFTFSSESSNDCSEWVRTVAKLMAPIAVMDHVGTIDIKLAGYAYIKESVVDEWRQTFIVFSWRVINYMNRDLKFNFIDLRKAGNIKMQDSSSGYLQRGQCFVISSTGKSVYLQATLARDTEKMYAAFLEASTSSGKTLNDQALTNENVPVIVERCITHIHMNGVQEKGIYRTAGQNSKVQELLDHFRRDAWSVSLSDYTVQDVANVLKRFLRELEDSVFERINYGSWINMAGCQDKNSRLVWYKYYLEKMPLVNFQTLKRIVLHLLRVSESEQVNLMSITNLASCFAPSLMRTATDEQPSLTSDVSSKEISIMVDLMSNADYFFNVNDTERLIRDNIQRAEIEIQKWNQDKLKAITDMPATGILTPIHLLCKEGQSVNILVTESKTAKEAMDDLKRNKIAPDLRSYVLYEQLFRGSLERPLFPEDLVALTTKRWAEWESWVMEDNSVCLCVQGPELLEKLDNSFNRNHELSSKLQYCDAKSRKFKRKTVRFQQCKLALYSDSQGISESISWKVEDMTIYLGTMHKKNPTPSRYCLTFTVSGEKYTKPPFGHCLCFDTEDELYRWAAAMYTAQHPAGLLSWLNK